MDDATLAKETFSALTSPTAFALYAAGGFYKLCDKAGSSHLGEDAIKKLSRWLKGKYESTWSTHFCNLFDRIFGEKHLSLKCFRRSGIASLLAVLFLYLLFDLGGAFAQRIPDDMTLLQVLFYGAAINILPDYLSLYETRWLLGKMRTVRSSSGQVLLLLLDLLISGAIITLAIFAYQWLFLPEQLSITEMLALFSVYSVFFYSTFLSSVWSWLYFLSTWLMRLFAHSPLKSILDVDKKPLQQIGLVGAALILLFSFVIAPPLFGVVQTEEGKSVSAFDQWLCDTFEDRTCGHLVRLTPEDQRTLEQLTRACKGGTPEHCMKAAFEHYGGNKQEAAELWRKACNSSIALGCANLGVLYEKGQGVPQDYKQAAGLYRRVCDTGEATGCNNLGILYKNGQGALQDYKQAAKLLRRACDAGDENGCYNLSFLYLKGQGVPQDYKKSTELYWKACDANGTYDCSNLDFLHENGQGIP